MLSNLIFSLNIVAPLFLFVALGLIFRRTGFVREEFFLYGSKVVFYIALPASLFRSIIHTSLDALLDFRFISFVMVATTISFVVIWIISALVIKDKRILGAFVQGSFRSNIVILGLPLMTSLAGEEGVMRTAILIAVVMPIYNIYSVIVLAVCADSKAKIRLKDIILMLIKNPLIIGVLLGVTVLLLDINLPFFMARSVDHAAEMATPLALICLGGGILFRGFDEKFKFSLIASLIKVAVMPALFVIAGYLFGFRGVDLTAIMMLGGTPAAIAGYVTVLEMGGDGYTAGTIVVMSTALSAVSLTVFIYVLRVMGMLY